MTPKTQSVCKHKHTEQRLTQHWENYCLDCNTYSSEAEPASTGEPPPDSVKLVGTRQPTEAEIEYGKTLDPMAKECLERNKAKMERAARPSEPSAPPACVCKSEIGDNPACPRHYPGNAAPQKSAELTCPHGYGPDQTCIECEPAYPNQNPAAPQPVSGDAPSGSTEPRCPECKSLLTMDGNPPTPSGCSNEDCPSATYPAAPSVAGTQPTPEEREETYYCPICRAEMYALPATIHCPICEAAPAQGTPEPPKVEELARLMYEANGSPSGPWEMFDKERRGYAKAGWLLNANVAIESLRPYFPPASQTPSGPLFAPKPNCPDCRGEGWKDRKDEEYCDPCHCLQVAVLGGRRVTSFLPRNADQAQWQAEVIDLHGKFPKITLSKKMVVGHRPEEGFHVEFVCLDREDVIHLAAMLHFYNESFKQPLAIPASTARTDRDLRQVEVAEWCAAAFGADQCSVPMRGLRMLEEAIEAYQSATICLPAEEMTAKAHALVDYVMNRVAGNLAQECGGVGLTLLALCQAAGVSAEAEELREIARVKSKPLDHFHQRNQAKNEAGFELAAPGSIPQAPKCSNCDATFTDEGALQLHVDQCKTLPNIGVPQAEPPK